MRQEEEAQNIKLEKKKSGLHNLKRKYDELKAAFEKQEVELAEVNGKHNTMVACVVLHTIRIRHV